jgi:Fe-S-cluster-containing dehydrogenase component
MKISRRDFIKLGARLSVVGSTLGAVAGKAFAADVVKGKNARGLPEGYDWNEHNYAMIVDSTKCIGCGRCANACKEENQVPRDPYYFRTWVERYIWLHGEEEPKVDSPNGGIDGFPVIYDERNIEKSYYVPKLCNQCAKPPCVQVCPVGASYMTNDGVVLIDDQWCIGCSYCVQACPYGARYHYPHHGEDESRRNTIDKCTFCYHRLVKGLKPACVQACPVGARYLGDLMDESDKIHEILREHRVNVLKPVEGTKPKVYYIGTDNKDVR